MAKSYMDLQEYDRAAHFLQPCTSDRGYFLYMYSRYLSGQKKRLDDSADAHGRIQTTLKSLAPNCSPFSKWCINSAMQADKTFLSPLFDHRLWLRGNHNFQKRDCPTL